MKASLSSSRFLSVYSGVLTLIFALTVITGLSGTRKASFEEIDVQRINVVEPDGTIRLVLSSRTLFPGLIFEGKEYAHPNRRTAGILFFNDEGTEQGGVTFGGATEANGEVSAYGHLSFDQYEQDQVFTIDASESGGNRKAGVAIWDRPDYSMEELIQLVERTKTLPEAEREAELSRFFDAHEAPQPRLYLGKSHDGSVSLRLNDKQGRERLIIEVAADGSPAMRILDQDGREVARFPASEG
jgi:hypothetical protein